MVRTFLFNLPLGCALSIICIHKSCLLQCGVVFIKKRHIIDCERNLNYINVCDLAVASCATKWRGYEFETALKYGLCTWMNFKFYFFGGKHEYVTFAFVFSKEFFSVLQFLPLSGMNIYNDCKHSFNCIFCWFILNIFDFTDKLAIDSRKRSISICQL